MSQQQVKNLLGEPNSINSQGDIKTLEYGDITVGVEDKNSEYTGGVFSIIVLEHGIKKKFPHQQQNAWLLMQLSSVQKL